MFVVQFAGNLNQWIHLFEALFKYRKSGTIDRWTSTTSWRIRRRHDLSTSLRKQICFRSVTGCYPCLLNLSEKPTRHVATRQSRSVRNEPNLGPWQNTTSNSNARWVGCSSIFKSPKELLWLDGFNARRWLDLVTPGGYVNTAARDVIYFTSSR